MMLPKKVEIEVEIDIKKMKMLKHKIAKIILLLENLI